jgi:hypothetical protein
MKLTATNVTESVDTLTLEPKFTAEIELTVAYEDIQNATVSPELADRLCLELGIQLFNQITKAL